MIEIIPAKNILLLLIKSRILFSSCKNGTYNKSIKGNNIINEPSPEYMQKSIILIEKNPNFSSIFRLVRNIKIIVEKIKSIIPTIEKYIRISFGM